MTTKHPPKNQEYSSASTIAFFFKKKTKNKKLVPEHQRPHASIEAMGSCGDHIRGSKKDIFLVGLYGAYLFRQAVGGFLKSWMNLSYLRFIPTNYGRNSRFPRWVVHACRPFCREYFLQFLLPDFIQVFLWMNAGRTGFICFTSLLQKVYFTPSISCFLPSEKRSVCLSEFALKPTNVYKQVMLSHHSWVGFILLLLI